MINKVAFAIIATMIFMLGKEVAGQECMRSGEFKSSGNSYRCHLK